MVLYFVHVYTLKIWVGVIPLSLSKDIFSYTMLIQLSQNLVINLSTG